MSWVGSPTAVRIKSIVTRPALGILAAPILARVAVILDENTAARHSITFTVVPTTSSTVSWPPIEYNEEVLERGVACMRNVLVWGGACMRRCLREEGLCMRKSSWRALESLQWKRREGIEYERWGGWEGSFEGQLVHLNSLARLLQQTFLFK